MRFFLSLSISKFLTLDVFLSFNFRNKALFGVIKGSVTLPILISLIKSNISLFNDFAFNQPRSPLFAAVGEILYLMAIFSKPYFLI